MTMKKYSINKNKTERWKADVQKSISFYNEWFLSFAPDTYINARTKAINEVENAFQKSDCFNNLSIDMLKTAPETISILRLATTPPLARDRLIGLADKSIKDYLDNKGYTFVESKDIDDFMLMRAGTYSCHLNVPAKRRDGKDVNMPIDVVIKRKDAKADELPVLIECKSAGDFTNTNKRRKEEATKIEQLKFKYGNKVEFILFLCGYFDSSYLGYEAGEGIDWIWEHRIEDFIKAGI